MIACRLFLSRSCFNEIVGLALKNGVLFELNPMFYQHLKCLCFILCNFYMITFNFDAHSRILIWLEVSIFCGNGH